MSDQTNRREFLRTASVAGTSLLLSPGLSAGSFFTGSPNDKVVLGIMGTHSRGDFLARTFAKLPNVEVGYICDVDQNVLNKTIADIEKITGKKPQGFTDIRKLLEKKDFDALAIAAPDHWHAPATIMGCQAGKHVYVEKPCSHNPHEGEMAVEAAGKYKRLVQMGSQRRSFSNVNALVADLRAGAIGRPYFARAWYTNWRPSIGTGKEVACTGQPQLRPLAGTGTPTALQRQPDSLQLALVLELGHRRSPQQRHPRNRRDALGTRCRFSDQSGIGRGAVCIPGRLANARHPDHYGQLCQQYGDGLGGPLLQRLRL